MHAFRPISAHVLAFIMAPVAGFAVVLLLAQAAGRLTRWRSANAGSGWMVSMPIGGFGWQVSSVFARAIGCFGMARIVFWLFGVTPTAYVAVFLALLLLAWDVSRFRSVTKPPMQPSPATFSVLRFKTAAGLLSSVTLAVWFLRI